MNEIENDNIALENILRNEALEIEDKLQTARSNNQRIKLIEDFLLNQLIQNYKNHEQISKTFETIDTTKGQISIRTLAEVSCLSIKHFERKFSEFVGLRPKQYLRIVRFQDALQKKKSNCYRSYTSLAFDCGYYDQSHFIHDFKAITDVPPKEFFTAQSIDY